MALSANSVGVVLGTVGRRCPGAGGSVDGVSLVAGQTGSIRVVVGEAERTNGIADTVLKVVPVSTGNAFVVDIEVRASRVGELS